MCLGMFINRAGSFVVPFLTLYVSKKLGLGAAAATWTMGAFGLGSMLAGVFGGHLADKIGRRVVMIGSLVGSAAVLVAFSGLESWTAVTIAAFILALVADCYRPAASAMIADLTTPAQRSLAYGLMYVAVNLGFAVAPVVGGLIAAWSYRVLFFGDALTCTAYAIIIAAFIKETLPTGPPGAHASTSPNRQVTAVQAARHILRDRVFLVFCSGAFLICVIFMQSMSTFPLYLRQLGFGERDYGWIIAVNGILITIFQLPLTAFLNRYDRAAVVALGSIILGLGIALNILAVTAWQFALVVVAWTLGEMMHSPYLQAIVSDLAPVSMRARYMGVFSLTFAASITAGAPLGGYVLEHAGGAALWLSAGVLGMLSGGMYWLIRREIRLRPADASATE